MNLYLILPFLCLIIQQCYSARILATIPFSGKSHYLNFQPILMELVNRGHHVTVITVFEEKNPPPNYEQIVVDKKLFWDFIGQEPDIFALEKVDVEGMLDLVWNAVYFTNDAVFNSTNFQNFIKNDKSHYDLIFVELFYQESMYMFAHKYKAPIVGICAMGFAQFIGESKGNPLVLPYMSHEFSSFGKKLSFFDRVTNFYYTTYDLFWRQYYLLPKHQKLAERHFSHLPGPLPSVRELEKNISVALINTHFSNDVVRPYVPGIVEIGGVHIKKPEKLPEKLQNFLDGAKDGAIVFIFGSNVKSKNMPKEKLTIFLNVFKKLKQRVIWKWEEDAFNEKPDNLMIGKWLPQNDILAHPNVKLFITHGGLLSTQESVYHGIPILGFPFYGDQFLNLEKVQELGYGLKLSFASLSEAKLFDSIHQILDNPDYMKKAKELSKVFRDRPHSAMDTAIYWIEYVIRHKGAPFLRSPILDMNWFEYHMIDFAALIALFVAIFIVVLYNILKVILKIKNYICSKICPNKIKKNN